MLKKLSLGMSGCKPTKDRSWSRARLQILYRYESTRPSLAAGSRPPRGPLALSPTPSFTSLAWRWRAGGLHLDTRKDVQLFTVTHTCGHTLNSEY